MDPSQIKTGRKKLTDDRGKCVVGTSATAYPIPLKRPRMTFSSSPSQDPQLRNDLQKTSYDLFQGFRYVNGRKVYWDAYANANFYPIVKNFLEDMGLADLPKMHYSPQLVNDFYSKISLYPKEYENPVIYY